MTRHPQAMLDAYLDQELPEAQSRQIAQHLRTCAACRAEYDMLLALRQTLVQTAALPAIDPAAFWSQLAPRLPARSHAQAFAEGPHHSLSWAWLWGAGMAAAAALTQLVIGAGIALSLASFFGLPLRQWLGLDGLLQVDPLPPALMRLVGLSSPWGALLASPAPSLLPAIVGLALSLAFASLCLGWLWAALGPDGRGPDGRQDRGSTPTAIASGSLSF